MLAEADINSTDVAHINRRTWKMFIWLLKDLKRIHESIYYFSLTPEEWPRGLLGLSQQLSPEGWEHTPHSWCSISPQSQRDRRQMSQVQGPLGKTSSAKRARYYTLMEERWLSHSSSGRKGSSAANAPRWNAIMNTTFSRLLSALTVRSLYIFLSWWVK